MAATADLRITWTPARHGWADCAVEANAAKAELTASYISSAPEDLLTAVARLVAGETETRAQFEAEPTAFRWIFYREDDSVWLRRTGGRSQRDWLRPPPLDWRDPRMTPHQPAALHAELMAVIARHTSTPDAETAPGTLPVVGQLQSFPRKERGTA